MGKLDVIEEERIINSRKTFQSIELFLRAMKYAKGEPINKFWNNFQRHPSARLIFHRSKVSE